MAATATKSMSLGTSIALAFTRSPTALAYTAWDLQDLSRGRLILGLGSQVKGHIERRFGVKWESPAPKMKEYVQALRAVWESWQNGTKLSYKGRFYQLDLMTPFFSPGPIQHPRIPTYVAGVNQGMCTVAGRFCDGLHVHPLHTARYLREIIRPAVAAGATESGRKRDEVSVAASVFAAVGENQQEIERAKARLRQDIAFYASTRTYRRMMDLHGWGDVCDRLHQLSIKGEWEKMAGEVNEEMLGEFVVQGTWSEIGEIVAKKYEGLLDRVRFYLSFDGDENWRKLVNGFSRLQERSIGSEIGEQPLERSGGG